MSVAILLSHLQSPSTISVESVRTLSFWENQEWWTNSLLEEWGCWLLLSDRYQPDKPNMIASLILGFPITGDVLLMKSVSPHIRPFTPDESELLLTRLEMFIEEQSKLDKVESEGDNYVI